MSPPLPSALRSPLGSVSVLFLLGVRSVSAWAEPPLPAGQGAAPASALGAAAKRPPDVAPAALMPSKVSSNDEPVLSAAVRAHHPCSLLMGRYRICVATDGSIAGIEPVYRIADPGADAEIRTSLHRWRFAARDSPACTVQTFEFEIGSPSKGPRCTQPLFRARDYLAQRFVTGEALRWPAATSQPTQTHTGVYRLCVDSEGQVTGAWPVRSLMGADASIIAALRTWRYKPLALPACTFEYIQYADGELHLWPQGPASPPPGQADTPTAAAGSPKAKVVPSILIKKDKLAGADPHLPDLVKARFLGQVVTGSYKVCMTTDGVVSSVDPLWSIQDADESIITTLLQWRYKPQPLPICFIQFLEYHIE